ncbi:hypothetical protein DSO57_1017483 [Entomophthora muscae]|uniref:Uncharacterized protein n=1 Tax=Entomophthora muscae TaxID=34485 RepID=A0ACC2RVW1_9FUNG|nr:hypothetical protein DSO57_1017483 [Entomophthora muscae]
MSLKNYYILSLIAIVPISLSFPLTDDKTYVTLADLRAKMQTISASSHATTGSNYGTSIAEPLGSSRIQRTARAITTLNMPEIHPNAVNLLALLPASDIKPISKLQSVTRPFHSPNPIQNKKAPPATDPTLSYTYGGDHIATQSTAGTKVQPSQCETYTPLVFDLIPVGIFDKEKYPCGTMYEGELIETDQCN